MGEAMASPIFILQTRNFYTACHRSPIFILLAHSFYTASRRSPLFILLTRIFCSFGTMKGATGYQSNKTPYSS